ncbi:hypothetical protein [Desulfopila sp. IMCC35008]|uniref:hypothetical protein n=1 Tax=Desulfopila sp. IMCC35008 TaxID=2653858 RepID=UPI0013D002E9|nr:hypothetical protein [Desulfopila sp. IMCC35008]
MNECKTTGKVTDDASMSVSVRLLVSLMHHAGELFLDREMPLQPSAQSIFPP